MTTSNFGMGTLRWSAPELLDGGKKTKILTGLVPFHYKSNARLYVTISSAEIPARALYPQLPEDNKPRDILELCWKRIPAERPTIEALVQMISDYDAFSAS
ncbi:hypothetical protein FRB94_002286 [Tulasnella sp. JGI-2019a]|nr:hypothetical protein FRB93_004426 [Tulasnella sp. JGI-2019a]KAG9004545.1 hypothetical protein FRB94_002286 [Tulasnella sp. JGI-2019a]